MKLTIITSFYGSSEQRQKTINLLLTYKEIEDVDCIIVDASKEKYKEKVNIKYYHQPASNIYEAINFGILNAESRYYLVAGDDDSVNVKAIMQAIKEYGEFDILTGIVDSDIGFYAPKTKKFPFSHLNYISQHSVGTVFNKKLHAYNGLYDANKAIAADAKFILKCVQKNPNIIQSGLKFGKYGTEGVSSKNKHSAYWEMFKICVEMNKYPSSIYYLLRSVLGR